MQRTWSIATAVLVVLSASVAAAADWPQFGGSPARNNTPEGKNISAEWNIGQFDPQTNEWKRENAKNVLWVARLGSQSYGTPVVAGGKVFCTTNNGAGWLKRYPPTEDLGCLLCFRQSDGEFLWQFSCEKHKGGRGVDWPEQGICATPLVEGDRVYVVTNRGEVACLDAAADPQAPHEARVIWLFDMMQQLGSVQHNMAACSVTAAGDLLLVNTGNGVDESHEKIPAPKAPSFIALDKKTGKLAWADASPGQNILHGQWASPAFAVLDGVPQAIFPGGDGWVYSFLAKPSDDGKPKLLWKFDCNAKESVWKEGGRGDRAEIIATPVICDGRVFIATGHDPEYGEAPGCLWCLDPTKRGDVSAELVVDAAGKPAPPRRLCAVDKEDGETVKPNPNSAVVWRYIGFDANGNGKLEFKEAMHRTLGMVAVKDGLLVVADLAGSLHCLDAKTGKQHWTYDMMAAVWGSPLLVDGKIYIGDEDGDMAVLELAPKFKLLAENNMGSAVYSSAIVADNVLYIATRNRLFAIGAKE